MSAAIFQVYYDTASRKFIDRHFIPYDNTNKCTVFFESEVIRDVFENKRHIWAKSDYVGVVSWRFRQKTNLSGKDVFEAISKNYGKCLYLMPPKGYGSVYTPYSISAFEPVNKICKIIDRHKFLPFNLYGYNPRPYNNWSNYFIVKSEIFEDYMNNYFMPLYDFLQTCNDNEFLYEIKKMVTHRGVLYPIHSFIMEGLFECYAHYNSHSFHKIQHEKTNEIEPESINGSIMKKCELKDFSVIP